MKINVILAVIAAVLLAALLPAVVSNHNREVRIEQFVDAHFDEFLVAAQEYLGVESEADFVEIANTAIELGRDSHHLADPWDWLKAAALVEDFHDELHNTDVREEGVIWALQVRNILFENGISSINGLEITDPW